MSIWLVIVIIIECLVIEFLAMVGEVRREIEKGE